MNPYRVLGLALVGIFLSACPGNSSGKNDGTKTSTGKDLGIMLVDDQSPRKDLNQNSDAPREVGAGAETGGPNADQGPGIPDVGGSPGFGQLCDTSCSNGETCLRMEGNATKGICLRPCSTPNEPCSVPDETKYFSGCVPYHNSQVGQVTVCMIFCTFQGQSFSCPNTTDYKCQDRGGGMAICIPK